MLSYAALILSYIQSFYNRQFDTRAKLYNETVANFYKNLEDYYDNDKPVNHTPTVSYFAEKANLSSNYFGDMIKHYTGSSPQDHIQQLIIQIAKNKLRNTSLTISEIAYSLGFDYPTYFTRFLWFRCLFSCRTSVNTATSNSRRWCSWCIWFVPRWFRSS